jgi:hypothetical protein
MSTFILAKDIVCRPMPEIDGDTASAIAVDVGLKTPPLRSRVHYGPAELAFRAKVQANWDEAVKRNPKVVWEIPD